MQINDILSYHLFTGMEMPMFGRPLQTSLTIFRWLHWLVFSQLIETWMEMTCKQWIFLVYIIFVGNVFSWTFLCCAWFQITIRIYSIPSIGNTQKSNGQAFGLLPQSLRFKSILGTKYCRVRREPSLFFFLKKLHVNSFNMFGWAKMIVVNLTAHY